MATAVRFCAICRKIFPANGKRKTCSEACLAELSNRREEAASIVKPVKQPTQPVKQPNSAIKHLPSPEEIRLKCSLMRSGLLVIESDGTPRQVDPAK